MDEIVADLLASTGAMGVWLLGSMVVLNNQAQNELLAAAVKDPAIKPPMKLMVEGEAYFDFVERQIFAERIGGATLLFIFDDRSSLGFVQDRGVAILTRSGTKRAAVAVESGVALRSRRPRAWLARMSRRARHLGNVAS